MKTTVNERTNKHQRFVQEETYSTHIAHRGRIVAQGQKSPKRGSIRRLCANGIDCGACAACLGYVQIVLFESSAKVAYILKYYSVYRLYYHGEWGRVQLRRYPEVV